MANPKRKYYTVVDPDFDTMFFGAIDTGFQEEQYQGYASYKDKAYIRPSIIKKPAIGKHSVWPELWRSKWRT
jgi:hypothetical protein